MQEKFEDTKGVIRSRKLKKDRQYSGQKEKDNRRKNAPLYITLKLPI